MPIRRSERWFYPIDWPELSRVIRFERAAGRCQHCGRPHLTWVIVGPAGEWWDVERLAWRDHRGVGALPSPTRLVARQLALIGFASPSLRQM